MFSNVEVNIFPNTFSTDITNTKYVQMANTSVFKFIQLFTLSFRTMFTDEARCRSIGT